MAGRPIVIETDPLIDAEKNTRPKYSHGHDFEIGEPRGRGMTHDESKSAFTQKDKIKTGLVLRQPL